MCLHVPSNRVYIALHVAFDEECFPYQDHLKASSSTLCSSSSTVPATLLQQAASLPPPPQAATQLSTTTRDVVRPSTSTRVITSSQSLPPTESPSAFPSNNYSSPSPPPVNSRHPSRTYHSTAPSYFRPPDNSHHQMITHSKTNSLAPKALTTSKHSLPVDRLPIDKPKSFNQASKLPQWQQAMQTEFSALMRNNTWQLVPPPPNSNIVGCKWVYKIKYKVDGSIERYKSRLVAKGFHQEEGIDYFDTFSPVIKPTTIRLVLSIALTKGWPLHQLDINNAFLNGDLNEQVFMEQPKGFVHPQYPNHVCLLKKALYGLKQAPRAWFTKLKNFSYLMVLNHAYQIVLYLLENHPMILLIS